MEKEKEKDMKKVLKELEEKGVKDIEEITIEIPEGTPLKEGETRTYIHVKADYMLPTGGTLDNVPGVKFEMVREDIGLVTQVIITDPKVLGSLKDLLTQVIFEQVSGTGMYQ